MNILFISRSNHKFGISPIIKNQGKSLSTNNINIDYFTISGKGFWGYFKSIFHLKKYIKQKKYDIYHAHYSLSGMVAALAGCKPLIVSLMGSDVKSKWYSKYFIYFFDIFFWKTIIVKSVDMQNIINHSKCVILPNGVDIERFKPLDRNVSLNKLGWNKNKQHILFASDPNRSEKNFNLLKESLQFINCNYQIHFLKNIKSEDIYYYLNATNVLVLSSLWEGSPNVIKEAMSCNCPIVSTRVGDVDWIIGDTDGCFLSSFDSKDLAKCINEAIIFSSKVKKTNGRERIKYLNLDSLSISKKLINLYNKTLN